ncbi:MAG: hypothetical protein ACE14S_01305 [Candidatus Bathyarchaeia archaeon]
MSSPYKSFNKPSMFPEVEGTCPLCNTIMLRNKSASFCGRFYSFDFPVYLCLNHYHGYFRWLGGSQGHVRILFPQIAKYGKIVCDDNSKPEDTELMAISCSDCGFMWEELRKTAQYREDTYCPQCNLRIELTKEIRGERMDDKAKLEEWRMRIVERLNLLDRQRKENPNDPLNDKRQIESDTLIWVLSNMP